MARFRYQRRLGLRARVTAAFALGALFTAALLAATTFGISREQLIRQRESSAQVPFFSNARIVGQQLQASGEIDVLGLLQDLQTAGGARPVLFFSGEWFSTDQQFGESALPASLRQVVLDGGAAQMRYSLDDHPELGFGIALQAQGEDAAYFEVVALDETADTLRSLGIILVGAAMLATAAGAALGWWAARRALLPLTEVGAAAAAIAGGRLDTRLEATSDPDLERLTESFNEMAQALEDRIARDERFASDVSHELRSPLMTLSASIEVLKARKDDLDERAQSALDLLVADVARFEQLVNDLLEISRLEAGAAELDLDAVDPSELVLHAVGAASSGAVPVHYDEDVAGTRVLVDKRRMVQVIANLLDNAEKYAGGATAVRVALVDDNVRIVVEDEGPGVPEEVRQKIFDRFARGVEGGRRTLDRGVGLGLALVAEHIRLHGGTVWVEDREDGRPGAAFVVELPGGGAVKRVAIALATGLLLLAVGCGVPEDDQPQELTADQVPFGLLTTPTTTTEPLQVLPPERRGTLYFVTADGQVTGIEREVEDQSPEAIITALLETDPTSLGPGLTSNIPPETRLLDISVDDHTLTVDLSQEFTTLEGQRFIAAVAQIVFTAAEIEGITEVAFLQEGEPLRVQDEEGAVQEGPVSPTDYQSLLDS